MNEGTHGGQTLHELIDESVVLLLEILGIWLVVFHLNLYFISDVETLPLCDSCHSICG